MVKSFFSLRNSRKVLKNVHRQYLRKEKCLDESSKRSLESYLKELHEAIVKKDSSQAKKKAKDLQTLSSILIPKTNAQKIKDFVGGLLFALFVAVLVRTAWFELYVIPTGSMRPTLKEEDYLVVSKTNYGINVPLQEKHFYFDEDLVQRGSTVVFNGANMNIRDADTVYFYLFPGKKQFVKRLIAKPGDTIYFYGGHIYGLDKENRPIEEFQKEPWFQDIEHIPYLSFEGRTDLDLIDRRSRVFYQMNQPIAKLFANGNSETFFPGKEYSDFIGMKHFAKARLLTPQELFLIHPEQEVEKSDLYLELTHHPSLRGARFPNLSVSHSILPLKQSHIETLANSITTRRFTVKNGKILHPDASFQKMWKFSPTLQGVPNGVYEIQEGKAFSLPFPKIPFLGIFTNGFTKELSLDHPLYSHTFKQIHTLFNLGIEPSRAYLPIQKHQFSTPSRYAYFRNGDLYVMGKKLFSKADPILKAFAEKEKTKPYPFIDEGAPSQEEIQRFGIRLPEKMYLALGDNHAMSSDSREFGFVPEENIKGSVSFLFAPPGPRWGKVLQPKHPHTTFPNMVVWIVFLSSFSAYTLYKKRKNPCLKRDRHL